MAIRVAAVVVAAGRGTRSGLDYPKQYKVMGGSPMVRESLRIFASHPSVDLVLPVIHQEDGERFARAAEGLALAKSNQLLNVAVIAGEVPVASADSILYSQILALRGCAACTVSASGMIGDSIMVRRILSLADSIAKLPNLPVPREVVQYTGALAHAYLTLDRRDTVAALREFLSLPDSLCHECGWSWLTRAQLLESQGRNAEAAAALDQVGVLNSPMGVLTEFERARIAEKLGDKARARDGYAFVAGMWEHGDPFFAQYAADSRAGLKRLSGENAGVAIPVSKH